jgi:ABC-type transport system involved in multi-copper enzyme maturation permease subunit
MTWLAWRQFRLQALAALAALVAIGVVLAYTGPHLAHLYQASGIAQCRAHHGDCAPLIDDFTSHYPWLHILGPLVLVVPGLVGIFWGAPLLARELETGTYRLVWTQSISRTRWLATKVAVVGAAGIAVSGVFSVMVALWQSPIDHANGNRFDPLTFSTKGIVPLAYAAFAFALGVAAGAVLRRVLPAMVATLAAFAGFRFAFQQWVRPHFAAAVQVATPLLSGRQLSSAAATGQTTAVRQNDWIVSARAVNAAGHTVAVNRETLRSICKLAEFDFSQSSLQGCAQRLHLHTVLTVQPARRYWTFQGWETAIFGALALALVAFTFWWTRRRIT